MRAPAGHRDGTTERRPADAASCLIDHAFLRATGAALVGGNSVRLLRDASENYPAWLEAIASAERSIRFESYIIHGDDVGCVFAEALARKAREGVRVRVLYDWAGARGASSRGLWRLMREAGCEVRCFNPPSLIDPLAGLGRDHRKLLAVDLRVAFVSGLCVGRQWAGGAGRPPWRDTGIAFRGPAVADAVRAFGATWALAGPPAGPREPEAVEVPRAEGDAAMRVVAGEPNSAGLYRLDQLLAAAARRSLWLTDAYFVATSSYLGALCAASRDGVDVRVLLPRSNDLPLVGALSRVAYRQLLEAGVRVFEWDGPMLHAKTAVADGRWARVGSSNLNLWSWIGNWELDAFVESDAFAAEMEAMYREDLAGSTEVVLDARRRVSIARPEARRAGGLRRRGSAGRAAAGAVSLGSAVGAVVTHRRPLGAGDGGVLFGTAAMLGALAGAALLAPRAVAFTLAAALAWLAAASLVRAVKAVGRRTRGVVRRTGRSSRWRPLRPPGPSAARGLRARFPLRRRAPAAPPGDKAEGTSAATCPRPAASSPGGGESPPRLRALVRSAPAPGPRAPSHVLRPAGPARDGG